jgi:formate hydrogenlyase subunit 3/multisubunit Na+/H+ antiporter MnhD subunit
MSAVFAAGLVLVAIAGLEDLIVKTRAGWVRGVPYLLGAAGAACLAAAGAFALAGSPVVLHVAGWLGSDTTGLTIDRLSGLFLVISFGAAFAVSLAFAAWASRPELDARRGLGASYALTLGAVAVFLTATDAFTLLLAWELLTLGFYLLAGFDREREDRISASVVTLAFGKISGAALLLGLLLLAARSGSLAIASFAHVPGGVLRAAAQTLLVAGFAIKVGLVPFQVWLPRGYAAAPGPARAIMGGVAVNTGFYGLWRTLALLGSPPAWLIGLLLVLAGLTALIGIAHAAVQPRLQRVIAYSSVENSGLILAGYGVALVGTAIHDQQLAAVGLLAGTLQIVAHAAAKSLLFTASAAITSNGSDRLDGLSGSARRRPWSGTGLAIGSLTLAGLPLTIGFASEWFLLEALMQQFRVPMLSFRLLLAVAGAAIALTAGFAGVTFVRLIGLVVLGPSNSAAEADRARGDWDYGWLGRLGIVVLSACCLAFAALLPLAIRILATGLGPVVSPAVTRGALKSPWVLQPVFSGFSILSPSWLWIVMPLLAAIVLGFTRLVAGTRMVQVRRVPAWRSATAGVDGPASYTASGYANPTRRILVAVLHTRSPEEPLEVVETYLYRPLMPIVLAIVRTAKRLQSGRLDAYLGYMLIALVALLAVVVAFA